MLRSRATKEIFNKSVALTKSDSLKEKIIGINILTQLGITPRPFLDKTLKLFFKKIKNETNPKIISALLYGIAHNNDYIDINETKLLSSFKENKNTEVRIALAFTLSGIKNVIAIDTLIHLSKDKHSDVRDWATFGIGTQSERNNKQIRTALWLRTVDEDQNTKLEAIVGLAKRKDLKINEVIKQELLNGEYGNLIFEAAELLNDEDLIPFLEKNLKRAKKNKEISVEWIKEVHNFIKSQKQSKN